MPLRKVTVLLVAVFGVASIAAKSDDPLAPLHQLQVDGVGALNFGCTNADESCTQTATVKGDPVGANGSLSFAVTNTAVEPTSVAVANCQIEIGNATLSTDNGTVTMVFNGRGCLYSPTNQKWHEGVYLVTGGTGNRAPIGGTGTFTWAEPSFSQGGPFWVHLDGNAQFDHGHSEQ